MFELPADPERSIWRYMRLSSLLDLVQRGQLHFARADTLGDPFEGSYPRGNYGEGLAGERGPARAWRLKSAVSCWHLNDDESAAMWRLYGGVDHTLAVRSTVGRLVASVRETAMPVYIGLIHYIDYDRASIPAHNAFYPLLHKRRSFAHENELRAVVTQSVPGPVGQLSDLPRGVYVPLSLHDLVESVYVTPDAAPELRDVVRRALNDTGCEWIDVRQSRLGEEPLF